MTWQRFFGTLQLALGCALAIALLVSPPVSANYISTTTLITAGTDNKGANGDLGISGAKKTISANGNIVAFSSQASNLVPGDTNSTSDIFVFNRTTKQTELISKGLNGQSANSWSRTPSMSADGRYIAYITTASNIMEGVACPGSDPMCANIIVHDRTTRTNKLANRNTLGLRVGVSLENVDGAIGPVISADGQFVAFRSSSRIISPLDTNTVADIFVRNLQANVTRVASVDNAGYTGNQRSNAFSISGDGRYVVFGTDSALVPEDTNSFEDIYLRDLQMGTTKLISTAKNGGPITSFATTDRPDISNDGRYVVFQSNASEIVAGDDNNRLDVFLHDTQTNTTQRISVTTSGAGGNDNSGQPAISGNGRYVVFTSSASNFVFGDANDTFDVFVHYRDYGLTRRVSLASHAGAGGNGPSVDPAISNDGKIITFKSNANNLSAAPLVNRSPNLYLFNNPVIDIPYYDGNDFFDLPWLRG